MKVSLKIKTIFIAMILIFPLSLVVAQQSPGIPHQFYGSVEFQSGESPDGLQVQAKIDGSVVATSKIQDDKYGYTPDLLLIENSQNFSENEIINFFVDGEDTGTDATFEEGGYTQLHLIIDDSSSTTNGDSENTDGGGGSTGSGGGGITITDTNDEEENESINTGDINGDDIVDIKEFNALIFNWGDNPENSAADLNDDGVVGIKDFNIIIFNWTI